MSISDVFPADARAITRPLAAPTLATLPEIKPGQLWLVEAPAAKAAFSTPARHALDGVNVVIYDRALANRLGHVLPLGAYAEPAADDAASASAAATRCVRFARDGWSVVRLMPPRLPQRDRLRYVNDFVAALAAAKVPGSLPVRVMAEAADGIREDAATSLDRLADTVATYDRDTCIAIVIDAFAGGASGLHAVAANGLAG